MIDRVGSNLAAQLFTQALAFVDRFILVGLLVRAWGPWLYSDWVVLGAAAGLLSIFEFGLGIYFGNAWQQATATDERPRFVRLVKVSIACYLAIVGVLTFVTLTFVLLGEPTRVLAIQALPPSDTRLVFALLAASSIISILRGSISQVYRGVGQFARGTIVTAVPTALYLAGAVVAVPLGASLVGLALLHVLCDVAGALYLVFDLRRRVPDLNLMPSYPRREEATDILRFTRWNLVLMGAPVVLLHAPVLILGFVGVTGGALVGFVLLRTLANYLRTVASLVSIATAVEMVALLHKGASEQLKGTLAMTGRAISALISAMCVGVLLLGRDFIVLWSGRRDLFDSSTMQLLLLSAVSAAVSGPLWSLFMLANKPRPAAIAVLGQLGLTLAGCALLASPLGIAGVAAALLAGEILGSLVLVPMMGRHHFGIDLWRYLGACAVAGAAAASWSMMVLLVAIWLVGAQQPLGFVACTIVFAAIGLTPVVLASLPRSTRILLMNRLGLSASRYAS